MISIGDIAARGAMLSPGKPALVDPVLGAARSFGQLADRSDLLGQALATKFRVGVGDSVAALSQNCVEFFELYLAAARTGATLFPLNWRFSASQVVESLLDAKPKVVFYQREFRAVVDEVKASVEGIEWIEWSAGEDSPYEDVLAEARAHGGHGGIWTPSRTDVLDLPYLAVSTGGTTGIPKSAVHSQRTYAACAVNYLAAARIRETDIYLMLGQLFHVIGYMPLAYLAMGRPVVIANFSGATQFDQPQPNLDEGWLDLSIGARY